MADTSSSSSSRRSLASLPAEILQHIAFEVALTTATSTSTSSSSSPHSSSTRPSSSSSSSTPSQSKHDPKRRRKNIKSSNNTNRALPHFIPVSFHLPALLLTCSRFYHLLNLHSNPSFYARLFRFHYDSAAILRRFGPDAVSAPALAAEYRSRAQRAAQILNPSDHIPSNDHLANLWTIYLLTLENDGRNALTLRNIRALSYLDFLTAAPAPAAPGGATQPSRRRHTRALFQPDRDYPPNTPEHALGLHIRHLLAPLPGSAQAREALSNQLRPFVFAAHRFDAFVAPWTYEHLPVGTLARYSFGAAAAGHQQQQHQQEEEEEEDDDEDDDEQPASPENNPYFADLRLRDRHYAMPYCGGVLHLSPPNAVLPACQMFFGLITQQQQEQEEDEVRRGQHQHEEEEEEEAEEGEDEEEEHEEDEEYTDDDDAGSVQSGVSTPAPALRLPGIITNHATNPTATSAIELNNAHQVGAITSSAVHEALITGNITLQQLFEALQAAAETVSLAAAASSSAPADIASSTPNDAAAIAESSIMAAGPSTSSTATTTTTTNTTRTGRSWGPSPIGPSAAAIAAAAVAASTALQDSSYLSPAVSSALTTILEDLNEKATQVASLNGSKRHLAVSALIADGSRREGQAAAAAAAAAAVAAAAAATGSGSGSGVSRRKAGKQRVVEGEEDVVVDDDDGDVASTQVDSRQIAESDHAAISRALSQALSLIRATDPSLLQRPATAEETQDAQERAAELYRRQEVHDDQQRTERDRERGQGRRARRRRSRQTDSTGSEVVVQAASLPMESVSSMMMAPAPLIDLWPSSAHDGDWRRLTSCLSPFISPGLATPTLSLTNTFSHPGQHQDHLQQHQHQHQQQQGGGSGGISGLSGTWEGQFAFFDFDSYRDMLSGRVSGLFDGQYGEQAQVWKLEEKVVRVSRKKGVVDWEREREWGNEGLAVEGGWEAGRRGAGGDGGTEEEGDVQEAASTELDEADADHGGEGEEQEEVDEILISGVGHSAWGHFILRGRVRTWDGLVTLVKEYRPDGRGRWRYRGYLVAGDRLVGRWRDTFSPPHMSGYEGCFLLRRREGLAAAHV